MNTIRLTATNHHANSAPASTAHIELTASSELMKNQIAALSIDPQHEIKAIQDSLGNPMLFSIGNDHVFYVILRDESCKTGWKQYDLSSAIGSNMEATAFKVGQGPTGQLLLALAMSPKGQRDVSTLYLTPYITNDTKLTDWSKIGMQWVARPFAEKNASISTLQIGACDGQTALGIAAVAISGTIEHYVFNTDAGDDTWLWKKYPLPENAIAIRDLAVGTVLGDRGVYALYDTSSGGQTLEFTTLPDPIYHKSSRYQFPLAEKATSITVLPGSGNSDDLYVAGDGIFLYPSSQSARTTLAEKAHIADIDELIVNQDDENVSIFAVCGDQNLMHTGGLKTDVAKWPPPQLIGIGVTQITALRNTYRLTNELFIVKGNSRPSYFYQDPISTIWKETTIDLPAIDKIIEFSTYTTHISLRDANDKPLMNYPIQLTASSWTYVTINGKFHSIDSDNPITESTDFSGNITIINRVSDISAPIYHIKSGLFAEVVDVNPTEKTLAKLKQIQSGNDLKSIKLHDGTPLVNEKISDATLNSAADAVKQLAVLSDSLPASGEPQVSGKLRTATKRSAHEVSRAVIHASLLPDNYAWGMSFQEAGGTYWLEGDPDAWHGTGEWIDSIELFYGDAMAWLEQKMDEIGNFFVRKFNGAVEFFVEIGTKMFKFVIETIESSFRVMNWVLKKTLDIDLEKLVQWLGFVFDWEDIKRVHHALVHLMNEAIAFGESKVHRLEIAVNDYFEKLKEDARGLAPIAVGNETVSSQRRDFQNQQSAEATDLWKEVHMSPSGNWGQYQLLHSGAAETASVTGTVSDPLHSFMNDVVRPLLESVEATAKQLGEDLRVMYDDDSMTLNQVIQKMTSDAVVGILDAIQKIVVGSIKFIEDFIKFIQTSINTKIEIPFFSAFYRSIAGSDLSILDAVMLVLAIPTTIGYKLAAGRAPFADEQSVFENGGYEQIFGLLSGNIQSKPELKEVHDATADLKRNLKLGEEEKVSPDAMRYSHWGGFTYQFAAFISDTLGLWAAVTSAQAIDLLDVEDKEHMETKAISIEMWSAAFSLAKIPGSFPVGNDEEVLLQRIVWASYFFTPLIELGLLNSMQKNVKDREMKSRAKGALNFGEGVIVFIMECCIFNKEFQAADDYTDNTLKLMQNCFYFSSKVTGGVAAMSEEGERKWGLILLSGAGTYIAGLFNVIRVFLNIGKDIEHQNF
jgi:hypothetical protein